MKRLFPFLLALLLWFPWASPAENIVANPSFRDFQSGGLPAQWLPFMPQAAHGSVRGDVSMFAVDPSDPSHPKAARDDSNPARLSSPKPVRCSFHQERLPFLPGQTLHLSVWMKGEGLDAGPDRGGWVRLAFNSRGDPARQKEVYSHSLFLKSPASTFGWKRLEGNVAVPPGTTLVSLDLFLWESRGTVWFRDPSVEVVAGPPNPPGAVADPCQLSKYRARDAAVVRSEEAPRRVVFMGDSITERWNLAKYFPGEPGFLNRGISAQSTPQMRFRFSQDALDLKPKAVWFLGGTNDLGMGVPIGEIVSNIRGMVRECGRRHIPMIVSSVFPVSAYHAAQNPQFDRTVGRPPAKIIALNRALEAMCREEGAAYLDLHSKLADAKGWMPAGFSDDGLHPNAKGYAFLAPLVEEAIEAQLAGPGGPR